VRVKRKIKTGANQAPKGIIHLPLENISKAVPMANPMYDQNFVFMFSLLLSGMVEQIATFHDYPWIAYSTADNHPSIRCMFIPW
jgi:hypothetical protein